jgi:oxygen-independent coproporphyrinogen-3 oxidase
MPRALYVHVPFCPKICPYCDFHKMRRSEGLVAAYLQRLREEALELYTHFPTPLDTIYLGGGTPSHLRDDELAFIVRTLETWGWPARLETTLEADPLTFDAARLETFKALGFSRLSIGLQSTQDEVLRFLGRRHSGREGLGAVEMALAAGFEVSADLITAVPGQDAAADLRALARTGVPHVSAYSLTIEPNTPFGRRGVCVDADKEADDYALADEILSSYGLARYEVSSHARPGHEAVHNQVYWRGDYFLALGPSAASFVPIPPASAPMIPPPLRAPPLKRGVIPPVSPPPFLRGAGGIGERRVNPPIKAWLAGAAPEVVPIGLERYLEDVLMTGLRTRRGVDLGQVQARSGIDVLTRYRETIAYLRERGMLELEGSTLRATDKGLWQLNGVVREFLRSAPTAPEA